MKNEARVFKALADETRLKMIALLLKHGELCVCDFEQAIGISQSKSSRHLRYLQQAGLLEDRREAVWVYYRVHPEPSALQRAALKSLATLVGSPEVKLADARLTKWLKTKGCGPSQKKT